MNLWPFQAAAVPEIRAAVGAFRVGGLSVGHGRRENHRGGRARAGWPRRKGKVTLLLVHRRELVAQAINTLAEACPGLSVGVEANGWPSQPWAQLQVGMVQSIVRRKHVTTPDLVIVDEAHHARAKTWEKVLNRWPKAARVGLTATPQRLDGQGSVRPLQGDGHGPVDCRACGWRISRALPYREAAGGIHARSSRRAPGSPRRL